MAVGFCKEFLEYDRWLYGGDEQRRFAGPEPFPLCVHRGRDLCPGNPVAPAGTTKRAGVFLAGMGGILFLTFKQSYVRGDDQHAITAATAFILIALACLAIAIAQKKAHSLSRRQFFYARPLVSLHPCWII